MIIAIIILAVILLALLWRPRQPVRRDDGLDYIGGNITNIDDPSGGYGWPGVIEPAPSDDDRDDFTPGGGDFGGGGSSGSWDDSGSDSGGDGSD
jgi:hypothetical protein